MKLGPKRLLEADHQFWFTPLDEYTVKILCMNERDLKKKLSIERNIKHKGETILTNKSLYNEEKILVLTLIL